MLIALSASLCALIVTKAKPLDSPLVRSLMILTDPTSPACVNSVFNSSWVVDLDRFPTYNLASIITAFSGLNRLTNEPPAHNRVGGQDTTQIQLINFQLLYSVYHTSYWLMDSLDRLLILG